MLPLSALKTEANTPEILNQRIRRRTADSLGRALAGGAPAIDARLRELDMEWDVERALETAAASFMLLGLWLGRTRGEGWRTGAGIVAGFLLQHAVQGWCPPLPIIRALGVRTRREIDGERFALKAARGDFRAIDRSSGVGPNTLLALAEL